MFERETGRAQSPSTADRHGAEEARMLSLLHTVGQQLTIDSDLDIILADIARTLESELGLDNVIFVVADGPPEDDPEASGLCMPMAISERVLGTLHADHRRLKPAELLVLETIASQVALVIDHRRSGERIRRIRDELTGMVVHDLKGPLTSLQLSLEVISELEEGDAPDQLRSTGGLPAEEFVDSAQIANVACRHLDLLIETMHQHRRLDMEGAQPLLRHCDVLACVPEVLEQFELQCRLKRVLATVLPEPELPTILADGRLVEKILQNLVSNAVKYSPEGGEIVLRLGRAPLQICRDRLRSEEDHLLVEVLDTGPGVPPEDREKIFETYLRVEYSRSHNKGGTGLGLAYCARAAAVHGGSAWVEEAPGGGANFCVLLPVFGPPSRRPAT